MPRGSLGISNHLWLSIGVRVLCTAIDLVVAHNGCSTLFVSSLCFVLSTGIARGSYATFRRWCVPRRAGTTCFMSCPRL
ncbi:hypothetical protein F4805DRAFT_424435 [Annulohypoxylon moriforme]|nr:hypothetical protein F4805DRAFT_424435 [Annulohypoxylon moriforme]